MKLLFLFCCVICLTPVVAPAIEIPRGVEAGSIEEQLKTAPAPAPAVVPPPDYRPSEAPEGAEKIHFTLKHVAIEGANAYPADRFAPLYADMLDKEVELADIYRLADRIRQVYYDDGYVLTQIFLPQQDIRDGNVRIAVTEGYISQLRWAGDAVDNALLEEMADKITRSRPFNSKILEDVMLRINGLPGITARAALEPLDAKEAPEGAAGIVITVTRQHVSGTVSADDYASRYLDSWESTAKLEGDGLFTATDRFVFLGSSSIDPARMNYSSLQYSLPVNASGTSINIGDSFSHTHPGYRLAVLDIFSDATDFNFGISQPLLRSREESLDVSGQFHIRRQETKVLQQPFSLDRLRTATLSGVYSRSDRWSGANLLDVDIMQGLDIFGASEPGSPMLSRPNGRSDFTKLVVNASRLQGVTDDVSLYVAATGQKASVSLLSSEQFGFGGSVFGRGYDASEISGDEGLAGSVELRWQAFGDDAWSVQPFGFYDIGVVRNKEPLAESPSAASAGLGVRAGWKFLHFEGNIAWPLTYIPATPKLGSVGREPRLNLSVGASF